MSETSFDAGATRAGRLRSRLRDPAVAVALLAICVVGPVVGRLTAQPASRYALTAALVDGATVDITAYRGVLGVDRARVGEELRSDKAPGQPYLAVPAYAVARIVGAEPAQHLRQRGNLGVWWVTVWSSAVPFAVLLALMVRAGIGSGRWAALVAGTAIAFGTFLMVHGSQLYGHVLAACLAFGAWSIACVERPNRSRLLVAGLVAGSAVAVDYTAVIVLGAVAVALGAVEVRRAGWFVLGASPMALAVGAYHWVAFGAPWHVPQAYYDGKLDWAKEAGSPFGFPTIEGLQDVLAGPHGLAMVSPVVLVGLVAAYVLARGPGKDRRDAILALGVGVAYVLLVAGWSSERYIEEPGPRYMIPALPFLAVPLATVWRRSQRWRGWIVTTAGLGAVLMAMGTVVPFLVPIREVAWKWYPRQVHRGVFNDTLWTMSFGTAGWFLHALTVAAALLLVVRSAIVVERSERVAVPVG